MTRADTSPAALAAHAHALADAFNVRLIEAAVLQPDEAVALPSLRVALVARITDETTYAVALHEIGHLAAPTGAIRGLVDGKTGNLQRVEEDAAWAWARHYALLWTPLMDGVARWAEGTYAAPPDAAPPAPPAPPAAPINWQEFAADVPAAPTAPVAPTSRIDWNNWK